MTPKLRALSAACLCLLAQPAAADDITDALNAALSAYSEGDVADALEELAYATQLLNALQAQGLTGFLPPPLDGWTVTVSDEATASLGFIGGGFAAEGQYSGPSGSFTITLMADNPIVAQMSAMLGNSAIMASMGSIERINRENFLNQGGDLSALIGSRVLIQAEGGNLDDMVGHIEQMDFEALEDFGS